MHSNSDVDSNQLLKDLDDKFRKTLGSVNVGEEPNVNQIAINNNCNIKYYPNN